MTLRASSLQYCKSLFNFALYSIATLPMLLSKLRINIQNSNGSLLKVISLVFGNCIMLIIWMRYGASQSVEFGPTCCSLPCTGGSQPFPSTLAYLTCSPVICFFTSTLAPWVCVPDTVFFKSPDIHAGHSAAFGFKGDFSTELLTPLTRSLNPSLSSKSHKLSPQLQPLKS